MAVFFLLLTPGTTEVQDKQTSLSLSKASSSTSRTASFQHLLTGSIMFQKKCICREFYWGSLRGWEAAPSQQFALLTGAGFDTKHLAQRV